MHENTETRHREGDISEHPVWDQLVEQHGDPFAEHAPTPQGEQLMATRRYYKTEPDQRADLAQKAQRLYLSGSSIRQISAELGPSYGMIHRLLSEAGVTLRSRGGARRGKRGARFAR